MEDGAGAGVAAPEKRPAPGREQAAVTGLRSAIVHPPSPSAPVFTRDMIVRAMVGREVNEMYPRTPHAIGAPLLVVKGLAGQEKPRDAAFTLHRGEILGIAGLVGAGRTEMFRALFGLDPKTRGTATLHAGGGGAAEPAGTAGVTLEQFSPRDWNRRGVGMLSEDRKTEGLAQSLSCLANITLPALGRASTMGFVHGGAQRAASGALGRLLGIKWGSPDHKVSSLSGGNQQKVALARLLYTEADVLLLDEPTRGIDVGAKVDLYRAIGDLAARGRAVVMISSYLPELFGVCDRIAVMARGALTPAYDVAALTPEKVMHMAVG